MTCVVEPRRGLDEEAAVEVLAPEACGRWAAVELGPGLVQAGRVSVVGEGRHVLPGRPIPLPWR